MIGSALASGLGEGEAKCGQRAVFARCFHNGLVNLPSVFLGVIKLRNT